MSHLIATTYVSPNKFTAKSRILVLNKRKIRSCTHLNCKVLKRHRRIYHRHHLHIRIHIYIYTVYNIYYHFVLFKENITISRHFVGKKPYGPTRYPKINPQVLRVKALKIWILRCVVKTTMSKACHVPPWSYVIQCNLSRCEGCRDSLGRTSCLRGL